MSKMKVFKTAALLTILSLTACSKEKPILRLFTGDVEMIEDLGGGKTHKRIRKFTYSRMQLDTAKKILKNVIDCPSYRKLQATESNIAGFSISNQLEFTCE